MKIETITPSHKGHSVRYSNGIEVAYDAAGIAEINDEDGEYLVEKYSDQVFPEGKVQLPTPKSATPTEAKNSDALEELRDKLQKANSLINDYKAQAGQAKEGERVWRMKCQELMDEVKMLRGQIGSSIKTEEMTRSSKKDDSIELKKQLEEKSVSELRKIVEELKLPNVEYKKMMKSKLIDLLIQVTTNG